MVYFCTFPSSVMKPVSATWVGHRGFPPSEKDLVTKFLATLCLGSLADKANELRGRDDCLVNSDTFARGREHVVFELKFGDGIEWVARIPLPHRLLGRTTAEIRSEVATIRFVCQHSGLPVPRVQGFDFDWTNQVGAPYVLMDAIRGRIYDKILPDIAESKKTGIYRQLAAKLVEMSKLPRWNKIGFLLGENSQYTITTMAFEGYHHLPAVTSSRDFYVQRANWFLESKAQEGNQEWIAVAWLYREAIPHFLQPQYENGPFPLRHPDFSNPNILYDDEDNVAGIIDWTAAQTSPWEQFARYPHEFNRRSFPSGGVAVQERELFLQFLEDEEKKVDPTIPMTKFIGSKAGRIAELVDEYHSYSVSPMEDIKELIYLIYGSDITWEKIKTMAVEQILSC